MTAKAFQLLKTLNATLDERVGRAAANLCRAATTYKQVQEAICNGHPAASSPTLPIATVSNLQARHERYCEKREARLEAIITKHAKALPGVKAVKFSGDPRGATVKLVLTNGRTDDWGGESICVPGS